MPSHRARRPGSRALSERPPGHLEVRGLAWRPFGRREPVLPGTDLDIPAGQRVLLVGPSGSGKSTLLRALAGVLEVADSGERSGTVLLDGEEPGARAGAVGLVLQEPGSGVVSATIGRDVAFGLENVGVPRADMPARVTAALAAVHLDMPQDTPTHALSGGEQQRLALAGALALEPTLLLLDEPTAMLDTGNAASVRASVTETVAARRLTTVVVEHRLGPWLDFADRLVVLDATGRVVADGAPVAVLSQHGDSLVSQNGHRSPSCRNAATRSCRKASGCPATPLQSHAAYRQGPLASPGWEPTSSPSTRQTSPSSAWSVALTAPSEPPSPSTTSGCRPAPARCTPSSVPAALASPRSCSRSPGS
jgi:energy-coupling factor transporter ATP-binding protein EcfA2